MSGNLPQNEASPLTFTAAIAATAKQVIQKTTDQAT
jgi:hypothetical protein